MATAALFTACSNETEEAAKQSMEVRFCVTNNNLTTRATTSESNGTYTTTFGANDKITIYSSGLKEDMNNVTGKVSGSNVTINGDAKYYYKDLTTTATFNAYHPMTATYSEGTVSFTVAANQNENFDNNEFMVATATGKGSEVSPVALSFEHQLALVVLNLSGLDDATEVTMNSVKPTVKYVFGTNTLTTEGEAIDITMNKRDDAQTYWAMVPAQTFAKDHKLFTIKTATATYTYTVTAELGLTTAKNTIHTITLSKKLNETSLSASISGWNETIDNWGSEDVEEEVPAPEVPQELVAADATTMDAVSLQNGSTTDLVNSTSWNVTTNESWYVVNNSTTQATATLVDASATDAIHGKYVNLTCTTVVNWYNTTLLYYIANAPKKKCTLSFSFKTDNVESNNGLLVFLGTRVGDTNKFIPTYTVNNEAGTTTYNPSVSVGVPNTADTWKDVTNNFDLSKLCATSGSNITPEEQNEETVSLWIGIQAKTAGKVYSIDDVKLTTIVE